MYMKGKFCLLPALGMAACLMGGGTLPVQMDFAPVFCAQAEAAAPADIKEIAGSWHEEDVADVRTLTVNGNGTYELGYKGGGVAYGTVKVSWEQHPDGTYSPWYNFYESDGTLWMGFAKGEESPQHDLWSGQDGAVHFARNDVYHATSEGVTPEGYLGIWGLGRCTVDISRDGELYMVNIKWASSAAENTVWTYPCTYDAYEGILFCRGQGVKTNYVWGEAGQESSQTVYENGSCTLVMREGVLTWDDEIENAGGGMELLKAP